MAVPSLEEAPELLPHARLYWEAFVALADRRKDTIGGSPEPIQYSEILAYLRTHAMDNDAELVADTTYFVLVLDRHFLNYAKSKIEARRRADAKKRRAK